MMRKIFLLLAILPTQIMAWGEIGHRVVGKIAERHLTVKAKAEIEKILKKESLAEAATWPDEVRSDSRFHFAAPWHFVEIAPGSEYDEKKAAKGGDALTAVIQMEKILRSQQEPLIVGEIKIGKKEALRYLVHVVGDIHQPLHVGNGQDMGANKCLIKWFDQVKHLNTLWNLHSVWDEALIDSLKLSFTELAKFIDHDVSEVEIQRLQNSNYLDWANESKAIRPSVYPQIGKTIVSELDEVYCKKYPSAGKYGGTQDALDELAKKIASDPEIPNLSYDYQAKFVPVVKGQLLKAGIRLAGVLNSIYK